MNNRAIKKLLSVVLVMAICISTVCGCLITVNAADTSATYTITAESLYAYADEGKATVTFNLDSGFTGGSFTLLKNDNIEHSTQFGLDENGNATLVPSPWDSEYSDVEIKVVSGVDANGNSVSADQMNINLYYDTNNNGRSDIEEQAEGTDVYSQTNSLWFNDNDEYKDAEGNRFEFDPENGIVNRHKDFKLADVSFDSDVVYKSVTFEFGFEWSYCMQPNSQNYIRFANATQKDQDGNSYSDPVLKKDEETVGTLTENNVDGNVNYFHSHTSSDVKANGQKLYDNDYDVYTDVCRFCGAVKNQLISDELAGFQPNAYYDISALNIVYEDNGLVSLNVHCPGFRGAKEKLVISYSDGKKTIYGDNKTSEIKGSTSFELSPYAKEKLVKEDTDSVYYTDNVLPADTYMYEIKGLSAKDIESKLYLTRIVEGNGEYAGKQYCGHTEEVSLMDYCVDVIEGEKVYYPEGTTEEQIKADKVVAVAFINYGVASANALNHKVSYDKEEVTVTDTWDGTKVEPTTKDEAGNIIINTAEELAWVALDGTNTTGKNYKVAPNSVFDMNGFSGVTVDSTANDLKTATKNASTYYWNGDSSKFSGSFDGNGVIIYNICGGNGWNAYGGLFPVYNSGRPVTGVAEFKNITVKASAFYGHSFVGGILGLAYGMTNDMLNVSNCSVENCYLSKGSNTSDYDNVVATLVGKSEHWTANISNSLAVNNIIETKKVAGGFIGQSSDYGNGITVRNSVSIGTLPESTVLDSNTVLGSKISAATYTNVYTDVESSQAGVTTIDAANMKGSAAVTNMSALDWSGVWVATDSYPTFNPDVYCTDVWDGTKVEPTTKDEAGNIIISTAEELAWVALQGGSETNGKNYKVADGIKYFNMNGSVGITADSTVSDVKSATATTNLWNYSADFLGTFDGNDIIVYNIRNAAGIAYGGLFPRINGVNSSIKNVTVKASIIYAYNGAGAIIGQGSGLFTTTIDNCAVENCYMTDNNDTNSAAQRSAGIFVGSSANHCIKINNCFAVGNECSGVNSYGGFVGRASAWAPGNFTFTNTISLGISPYTTAGAGDIGNDIAVKATWSNVYTDTDLPSGASANAISGIKKLTTAQMQGEAAKENMSGLAWGAEWFEGKDGEYPSINGDVYADTWDGTKVEPTETDSEGNIIINTAEELAWIALEGGAATQGKNYKVADGMKYFNMSGMDGITLNSTVADVQAATKTYQMRWIQNTDNDSAHAFGGNFDGNGLTVYNISAGAGSGQARTGLFPVTRQSDDGLTQEIKNVQVVASYFVGYHSAGAVVGLANAPGTSCVTNFSNIMVKNCYVTDNANTNDKTQRTAATVVGNVGHNKSTLNNCLVVNTTTVGTNIHGGFIGNSSAYSKGVAISNSVMIGNSIKPVDILDDDKKLETPAVNATYSNVYTDQATSQQGVTTIDADDATGAGANLAMPGLAWGINWFTGKPGEYPCFVDDGVDYVPDEIEELLVTYGYYSDFIANFANNYEPDNFTTSNENCDFYATGLTLKTNPYMTVTFAFHDEYRTNKANVEAVFTVNEQEITVKATDMVNNDGAGRYHMVRLKDINVANLCDAITVTLKYNGSQVGTGSISVAGFAFTAADAGEGFEYYESAAQALVFYAEALQKKIAVTTWPQ